MSALVLESEVPTGTSNLLVDAVAILTDAGKRRHDPEAKFAEEGAVVRRPRPAS